MATKINTVPRNDFFRPFLSCFACALAGLAVWSWFVVWRSHRLSSGNSAIGAELPPRDTGASLESRDDAEDRVPAARSRVNGEIRALCQNASIAYPPRALLLRAFKRERELEVWARGTDATYRLLAIFPVTASSGGPGPKRKEGDLQVPEGFYTIDLLNPLSQFHLSLRVNYPNAADLLKADPKQPGSDIYIHGGAVSIGCLPLGDENIEKLYVLALDSIGFRAPSIPIHLFPTRMSGPSWESFLAAHQDPDLIAFWQTLQPGYDQWEQTHQPPRVTVAPDGTYLVAP